MPEKKQEVPGQKQCDAVFGLTIPPPGIKFVGTGFKIDINGAVLAIASDLLQQNTCWKAEDGRMVLVGNILMRADSSEELRKQIHIRVDKVFDSWAEKNKQMPAIAGIHVINPTIPPVPDVPEQPVVPSEQQPAKEALDDIASGKTKTIEVESELNPGGAEVS